MPHILDLQLWADDLELSRLPALNDELVAEIQSRTDGWTLNSVRIDAVSDAAELAQTDASLALSQIYTVDLGAQSALLNAVQNLKDQLIQEMSDQIWEVKEAVDQKIQDRIDTAVNEAVIAVGGISAGMASQYDAAMGRMDDLTQSTDYLLDTELPNARSELEIVALEARQALSSFDVLFTDYVYPTVMAGMDDALTQSTNAKADALEAYQLAIDNLNIAKDYTDTSIETEQVARVAEQEALAAQIRALTAVLNSENYLQNPRFTDGTAGWTLITGPLNVVDRDEGSPDPIIATAPTPKFAMRSTAGTGAHALEQSFEIEMDPGEVIQWRLFLTAQAVIPAQVRLFWFDEDDAQIGAAIDKSITIVPGEWRVFSGQMPPPAGAARLRFNIFRSSTAGTTGETAQLCVADASVTKVDVSVLARIIDLEVVVANNEGATTLWQSNAESRFEDAEDELDAVAIAMSNRYTKAEADAATAMSSNQLSASFSNALARSPVGLVGKADPVLRPFGTSSVGTVETYGVLPASAYGEDADGPYVTRATSTGAAGVHLRATAPSRDDAVYRVTYRVKPLADLDFRLRCSWLTAAGSSISATSMATHSLLAADGLQEISVVVGRYSGGLVDVAAGGANWGIAHMLRFGIDNWPATAGEAYRVYEIRVDDLSGEDAAARNIANVQASVTSEQIARANADTALAHRATSLETRMGTAETRITNETLARSNADTALAGRTTALETTTGLHNARIGNTELAISNQTSALAAFDQRVEAQSLGQNLVLDGVFAEGLVRWPAGSLSAVDRFYSRNPNDPFWVRNSMPADRALQLHPSDGSNFAGTDQRPVRAGEEIEYSAAYARGSGGIVPRLHCQFYDRIGGTIRPPRWWIDGTESGRWAVMRQRIIAPVGAVSASVYVQRSENFPAQATRCWVTNVAGLRGQEAYASGALQISTEAAPSGAVSRIGLRAKAEGAAVGEAAVYLEARSDGTSRIINSARQFYVYDGTLQQALFAIRDGKIYLANAMADTLSIKDGSVITQWAANSASLTITTSYASKVVIHTAASVRGVAEAHSAEYRLRRNGATVDNYVLSVNGTTSAYPALRALTIPAGTHTFDFSYVNYTGSGGGGGPGPDPVTMTQPRIAIFGGYR